MGSLIIFNFCAKYLSVQRSFLSHTQTHLTIVTFKTNINLSLKGRKAKWKWQDSSFFLLLLWWWFWLLFSARPLRAPRSNPLQKCFKINFEGLRRPTGQYSVPGKDMDQANVLRDTDVILRRTFASQICVFQRVLMDIVVHKAFAFLEFTVEANNWSE